MSANPLTNRENEAMRVIWDKGSVSVNELAVATRQGASQTLNTLRSLVRKGAVDRRQQGRQITYRPLLNRSTAQTHALGRLLNGESPAGGTGVVVLRECDVDPQDWADLQAEIEARRAKRAQG